MREALSETLVELASKDERVLLLTGDHGYSLFDAFRRVCPGQYINAGVAEQNMVGVASGLARAGFRPIVYGLSAFIPIRVLEQIKLDIAHDMLPVIFLGDGAGFVYSHLGTSHQSTEDIACARSIPNLHVFSPADSHEMKHCFSLAYKLNAPVYIRVGKSDLDSIHYKPTTAALGDLILIKPGDIGTLSILATGSMVATAQKLCNFEFPQARLWTAPFIKPINNQQIIEICRTSSAVITLEEHSVFGGFGSVVAEISSAYAPTRIFRIGVEDQFSKYCGSYNYLLKEHRLDFESLKKRITSFIRSSI
jgi:transketolase